MIGLPASRSRVAHLYLNGQDQGLYLQEEQIDESMMPAPHERTMVGSSAECIEKLHRWKDSGAQALFLRPFEDGLTQMRLFVEQVRPGITGLWQVKRRSEGDLEVQQALDTYYIRNWSLWLDLHILFRTVAAVTVGRGAR